MGLAAFDPGRRGLHALAVVAALAVAVAAVLAWQARPRPEPVAVLASPTSGPAPAVSASGFVVVAVAGRVRNPGLVRLPVGARVADALDAAGGALPGTDLSFLNLARKLVDGELIVIGVTPPPGAVDAQAGGASVGKMNLNTATAAQLETLPGVGPVLAQHIVDYRTRHGGFRSIAELRQVDGVGEARYAQLKDLVEV
jgi:competence protein ComEA